MYNRLEILDRKAISAQERDYVMKIMSKRIYQKKKESGKMKEVEENKGEDSEERFGLPPHYENTRGPTPKAIHGKLSSTAISRPESQQYLFHSHAVYINRVKEKDGLSIVGSEKPLSQMQTTKTELVKHTMDVQPNYDFQ
jgi:hypothetical protein